MLSQRVLYTTSGGGVGVRLRLYRKSNLNTAAKERQFLTVVRVKFKCIIGPSFVPKEGFWSLVRKSCICVVLSCVSERFSYRALGFG